MFRVLYTKRALQFWLPCFKRIIMALIERHRGYKPRGHARVTYPMQISQPASQPVSQSVNQPAN